MEKDLLEKLVGMMANLHQSQLELRRDIDKLIRLAEKQRTEQDRSNTIQLNLIEFPFN